MNLATWPRRRSIIQASLDLSNRMAAQSKFYSEHLQVLVNLAYQDPENKAAVQRYERLCTRYKRESTRLIAQADALMASPRH